MIALSPGDSHPPPPAGVDKISFATFGADIKASMAWAATDASTAQSILIFTDVEDLLCPSANACIVVGNALNNHIVGSSAVDTIDGAGGDDTIESLAGDDAITCGSGSDIHVNSAGTDTNTAAPSALQNSPRRSPRCPDARARTC